MASTTILNGQFAMFQFMNHKKSSDAFLNVSTFQLESTGSKSKGWYRRCIDSPDDDIDGTISTIPDHPAEAFERILRVKRNDAFWIEEATPRRRCCDAVLHKLRCSCRSWTWRRYECFGCGKGRGASVFKFGEDVECVLIGFRMLSAPAQGY